MATYTKKLKTLEVHLMLDGETRSISDTSDDNAATRALNEFKAYGTMRVEDDEALPYHAVQYIKVREGEEAYTGADPYNCKEGGDR